MDKHIVSFSGGKDSTAMLLKMIELNCQIDEIIFCDTGIEFPEMYEHIKQVENYTNRKVTIIKSNKSFEYYMFNHVKSKGKNKGEHGLGWPNFRNRWCTGNLKTNIFNKYIKDKYKNYNIKRYIGIAYDEQKRIGKYKYPLVEWRMTEQDCLDYCYERGFDWGGLYNKFSRVSCYLCPLSRLEELEVVYKEYPELWSNMVELDKKSIEQLGWQYRNDYSVEELEEKFSK